MVQQNVQESMEGKEKRTVLDFGYYNMDCMEGMKQFPDKFFDLAIVDPPYGIGEDGSKNYTRINGGIPATNYKPFAGGDK